MELLVLMVPPETILPIIIMEQWSMQPLMRLLVMIIKERMNLMVKVPS